MKLLVCVVYLSQILSIPRGCVGIKGSMLIPRGCIGIKGSMPSVCVVLCVMRCMRLCVPGGGCGGPFRLPRFADTDSRPQMVSKPVRPGPYVVGGGVPLRGNSTSVPRGTSKSIAKMADEARALCATGVYVVELKGGRYYVGQSANIPHRMRQHRGELPGGSAWCKANTFLGRVAPMTPKQTDLESWERTETLARMHKHGIDAVRGWMYVSVELTQAQREHVFQQVCEKFNLCRVCGGPGHYAAACRVKGRARWFTRFGGGAIPI